MRRRYDSIDVAGVLALAIILGVLGFIIWAAVASAPQLTAGVCTDKTYDPPYTVMRSYTTGSGDSLRVRMRPEYHPASWSIQVSGTTEDGKPRTEWWAVGEGMYSEIQIGDYLERLSGCVRITRKATP